MPTPRIASVNLESLNDWFTSDPLGDFAQNGRIRLLSRPRRRAQAFLVFVLLWSAASNVFSQIPVKPDRIEERVLENVEGDPLGDLAALFLAGDWDQLQLHTKMLFKAVNFTDIDLAQDYCMISLVSRREGRPHPEIFSYLAHYPSPGEPFQSKLPGISGERFSAGQASQAKPAGRAEASSLKELYDVFFTYNPEALYSVGFVSTPQQDVVAAEIPKFLVKALTPGIPIFGEFKFEEHKKESKEIASIRQFYGLDDARPKKKLFCEAARISLPDARSKVVAERLVEIPDSIDPNKLFEASAKLKGRVETHDGRWNECAKELAANLDRAIRRTQCSLQASSEKCFEQLQQNITKEFENNVANSRACQNQNADGWQTILSVEEKFLALVTTEEPKKILSKVEYENIPSRRFNFGLLIAAIVSDKVSAPRAKIDNGVISSDPLSGALTMAIVNIHPFPYDERFNRLSFQEKFRLFAGAVLTPEFGAGGGIGYSFFRGFSVNAGVAGLFIKTPKSGESVGQAPGDLENPLKLGAAAVAFFGFSYAFE